MRTRVFDSLSLNSFIHPSSHRSLARLGSIVRLNHFSRAHHGARNAMIAANGGPAMHGHFASISALCFVSRCCPPSSRSPVVCTAIPRGCPSSVPRRRLVPRGRGGGGWERLARDLPCCACTARWPWGSQYGKVDARLLARPASAVARDNHRAQSSHPQPWTLFCAGPPSAGPLPLPGSRGCGPTEHLPSGAGRDAHYVWLWPRLHLAFALSRGR